jgi:hypothetical protein
VAVVPLNIHALSCGEMHLNRPGISGRAGRLERGLHGVSIAWNGGIDRGAADASPPVEWAGWESSASGGLPQQLWSFAPQTAEGGCPHIRSSGAFAP